MSELSLGQIKGLSVNSNVVTVPSGHTLYAPGHVIQVTSTTLTSSVSTTSTSYVDVTGVSVSITPKLASSKILVLVTGQASNSSTAQAVDISLLRGSTEIYIGSGASYNVSSNVYTANPYIQTAFSLNYLDSPATTSSTTYKLQFRTGATGTAYIGRRGQDTAFAVPTTITLMEIAA